MRSILPAAAQCDDGPLQGVRKGRTYRGREKVGYRKSAPHLTRDFVIRIEPVPSRFFFLLPHWSEIAAGEKR